jgi:hypothetical protein
MAFLDTTCRYFRNLLHGLCDGIERATSEVSAGELQIVSEEHVQFHVVLVEQAEEPPEPCPAPIFVLGLYVIVALVDSRRATWILLEVRFRDTVAVQDRAFATLFIFQHGAMAGSNQASILTSS